MYCARRQRAPPKNTKTYQGRLVNCSHLVGSVGIPHVLRGKQRGSQGPSCFNYRSSHLYLSDPMLTQVIAVSCWKTSWWRSLSPLNYPLLSSHLSWLAAHLQGSEMPSLQYGTLWGLQDAWVELWRVRKGSFLVYWKLSVQIHQCGFVFLQGGSDEDGRMPLLCVARLSHAVMKAILSLPSARGWWWAVLNFVLEHTL